MNHLEKNSWAQIIMKPLSTVLDLVDGWMCLTTSCSEIIANGAVGLAESEDIKPIQNSVWSTSSL